MITIPSAIEGESFSLHDLEQIMKPLGYVISGGWEYDHCFFDYKIDDKDGYLFLRVPAEAKQGQLDESGAAVRMGTPFLLRHVYQAELDDHAGSGQFQSMFNQFSEPERRDADIDQAYMDIGISLVKELEDVLLH
ncbi:YugN-like family protein [Bacillus atrophaeus]|uniref:YugN-like family protein n=1 Tax=Bacillus atrophaeus TaxID=1452 RepID=UPI002281E953|nr:YugN-like family protein [Bacillus atrophaeus]MCY8839597.1 YugN-like family protein [Bacillus atrophaeus]MEC0802743.1 YugN-like family protein [Bacillus atrophaeus]MEC0855064.1 YugN-like family protein [Bacillus atrophaeus]MEC0858265.1 YugN-like family protein [Bacillus atrophaeus]MEC0860047.1 YugN-like family protein [Bacillus atrophaeus]